MWGTSPFLRSHQLMEIREGNNLTVSTCLFPLSRGVSKTSSSQTDIPSKHSGLCEYICFLQQLLVHETYIRNYQTKYPMTVLNKMKERGPQSFWRMPKCRQHMLIPFSLTFQNIFFKSYKRENVCILLQEYFTDIWKILLLLVFLK